MPKVVEHIRLVHTKKNCKSKGIIPELFARTHADDGRCITNKKTDDAIPSDLQLGAATAMPPGLSSNRSIAGASSGRQKLLKNTSTAAGAGSGPASLRVSRALGSHSIADGMSADPGRIHQDPTHAVTIVTFNVVSRHSAHAFTDLSGCVAGAEEFQQGGTNFLFFS